MAGVEQLELCSYYTKLTKNLKKVESYKKAIEYASKAYEIVRKELGNEEIQT